MVARNVCVFLCCVTTSSLASANLVITEVVDGTIFGVGPRYVEVTNLGNASLDLSGYSLGWFVRTSASATTMALSGTLNPRDSYVISFEFSDSPGESVFYSTYGFDPDHFGFNGKMDGGDTFALFEMGDPDTIVDMYGVIGLSAKFQAWNFLNGFSFRDSSVSAANPNFSVDEWTFSGANSLNGANNDEREQIILANTSPGTFAFATVPEPSAVFFGGLVCIAYAMKYYRKTDRG